MSESNRRPVYDGILNTMYASYSELQAERLQHELNSYAESLRSSITTKAGHLADRALDINQGFVAEAHHAASYNIEAAAKGVHNIRADMESLSAIDPVSDVRITSSSGDSVDFQMKFYKNGERTAKAFNHERYNGVGKVASGDQLDDTIKEATRQSARNRHTRPEISDRYQDTSDRVTDSISHPERPDIKSQPLNRKGRGSSEDLTRKIKKGDSPEYGRSHQVQREFQGRQYANAAKYGALSGAVTSAATQLYSAMTSDKPLSKEDCLEISKQVVYSAAAGAGKAMMTTGVQHAGKELAKRAGNEALKTIGRQLSKGNVAANMTILITQFGADLYKMSQGEIDSVELAESTINNSINLAGAAVGFSAGKAAAAYIAPMISSTVAETAILGTTLGALGPIALGMAGCLAATAATAAYCNYFTSAGRKIAIADIETCKLSLQSGSVSMAVYAGKVGVMSELKFQWKDLLPLAGTFSVLGEYRARKQELVRLQSDVERMRSNLSERETQALYAMLSDYRQQVESVKAAFDEQHNELLSQAGDMFNNLNQELDSYLQMNFALHSAVYVQRTEVINKYDFKAQQQLQREQRANAYREQLKELKAEIAGFAGTQNYKGQSLMLAIDQRLANVLPRNTPYDQSIRFFMGGV